jgi:hypothetical protein
MKLNLNLFLEVEVKDTKGKIVYTNIDESKSLLKNFATWLKVAFIYCGNETAYDTSHVLRTITDAFVSDTGFLNPSHGGIYGLLYAGNGDDLYGIQVGTGDTAVDRDNYALISKISNGITTGKLSYGTTTVENEAQYLTYTQMRVIRTFSNNSSATITVKEAGLVIYFTYSTGTYYFLIARDLLTSPVDLNAGYTLTVRYIFRITA